tara:strand:+ start:3237 stop:4976 length:1740 start_codon:yes stop_codon:yes gene_type:complete
LTDLIERERRDYEEKLESIESYKDNFKLRKTLGMVFGAVGTLPGGILALSADDSYYIPAALVSLGLGSCGYIFGAGYSDHIRTPKSFKEYWNMEKNYARIEFGAEKNIDEAWSSFLIKHSSSPLHKMFGEINYDICQGDVDSALSGALGLVELYSRSDMKRTFAERLLSMGQDSIFYLFKKCGKIDSAEESIYAIGKLIRNDETGSEKFFQGAIDSSSDCESKINSLCLYGSFLDNLGRTDEAKECFENAISEIVSVNDEVFDEIPGTKNKVYVHNSEFIGGTFIFKTGENLKNIVEEYNKTKFVHNLMENSLGRFVRPLVLTEIDKRSYVIIKRSGNFSLRDYIEEGHTSEAYSLMEDSLDEILLFHLKTNKNLDEASRFFEHEDYVSFLNEKFLSRDEKIRPNEKRYNDVVDGLRFIGGEIEQGWSSLVHKDFHPGNIIVNKKGEICIIDFEKAKINSPYVDAVTLIEDYSSKKVFDNDRSMNDLIKRYNGNAVDSNVVESLEESMKNYHLSAVFEHLHLLGSSVHFVGGENLPDVREYHLQMSCSHLKELESFYSKRSSDGLRNFRISLEDSVSQA